MIPHKMHYSILLTNTHLHHFSVIHTIYLLIIFLAPKRVWDGFKKVFVVEKYKMKRRYKVEKKSKKIKYNQSWGFYTKCS